VALLIADYTGPGVRYRNLSYILPVGAWEVAVPKPEKEDGTDVVVVPNPNDGAVVVFAPKPKDGRVDADVAVVVVDPKPNDGVEVAAVVPPKPNEGVDAVLVPNPNEGAAVPVCVCWPNENAISVSDMPKIYFLPWGFPPQ